MAARRNPRPGRWRLRLTGDVYDYAYFRQRLDLLALGPDRRRSGSVTRPRPRRRAGDRPRRRWSAGRLDEAAATAARGVALAGGPDAPAAALALEVCADLAMFAGRTDEAVDRYRRRAALRRRRASRFPRSWLSSQSPTL